MQCVGLVCSFVLAFDKFVFCIRSLVGISPTSLVISCSQLLRQMFSFRFVLHLCHLTNAYIVYKCLTEC